MYVTMQKICPELYGTCILFTMHKNDNTIKNILFDCGLTAHKEKDKSYIRNNLNIPNLNAIIVSHAHLDHISSLPLLNLSNYKSSIYLSNTTQNLLKLMPISKSRISPFFKGIKCNKEIIVNENISFTFFKNGHIPGAVCTLLKFSEMDESVLFFITGDFNNTNSFFPIPSLPSDILQKEIHIVSECTNSLSFNYTRENSLLRDIKQGLAAKKRRIIIEANGLGKCQEVLFLLNSFIKSGKLTSIPIEIYGHSNIAFTKFYQEKDFGQYPEARYFLPENVSFCSDFNLSKGGSKPRIMIIPQNYFWIDKHINKNILFISTHTISPNTKFYTIYKNTPKNFMNDKLCISHTNEIFLHANYRGLLNLYENFTNIQSINLYHAKPTTKEAFKRKLLTENLTNNITDLEKANQIIKFTSESYEVINSSPNDT